MKMKNHTIRKRGFTLPELLIAVIVVAILAMLLFSVIAQVNRRSKDAQCLQNIRMHGSALFAFIADRQGVPWWDGNAPNSMAQGSTTPAYNAWLENDGYLQSRLRCPNSTAEDRQRLYGMGYGVNTAFNIYYAKNPFLIPAPHHRVVLVSECYGNGSFYIAGHLNRTIWANDTGATGQEGTAGLWPKPQYHGSSNRRGLHLFFLDGHASLVFPGNNDWRGEPVFATSANGGYVYDRDQIRRIANGSLILK